jgi:hypothetical protein
MLLLLIVLLFFVPMGGGWYNNGQYRTPAYGLGFLIFIVVLFLLLDGNGLAFPHLGCR